MKQQPDLYQPFVNNLFQIEELKIKFDPKFEEKFKVKKLIKSEIDFKKFVRELSLEKEKFFSLFDDKSVRISFLI